MTYQIESSDVCPTDRPYWYHVNHSDGVRSHDVVAVPGDLKRTILHLTPEGNSEAELEDLCARLHREAAFRTNGTILPWRDPATPPVPKPSEVRLPLVGGGALCCHPHEVTSIQALKVGAELRTRVRLNWERVKDYEVTLPMAEVVVLLAL